MIKDYVARETVFFICTVILCVVVLFHYIFPFALGITFAYLLEPVVDKLMKLCKTKKNGWKWFFSLTLIIISLVLVCGPILTLITTAIQELLSILVILQHKFQGRDLLNLSAEKISNLLKPAGVNMSIDDLIARATDVVKNTSQSLLVGIGIAVSGTPEFLLKSTIFIFTACFFLVYGKNWRNRFVSKIFPWPHERNLIAHTCSSVLKALIVANVLVALVQACLITVCFAAFGIPRFILWGMVGFFISFVPLIGTAPLMLGAAAWCYFHEDRLGAAIGIVVCGVLISIFDNILRPYFMKGGANIEFFWIFLAIIGGMSVFGIPGAVIGPVAFALFAAALTTLERTTKEDAIDQPSKREL